MLTSKLTAISQQLLDKFAPIKKKEVLPLWRIHCKDKGHAPWASDEFKNEDAALAALETSVHARHAAMVVPGIR